MIVSMNNQAALPDEPANPASLNEVESLAEVLGLVRFGAARTRHDVSQMTGLGRTAVTNRLNELIQMGLVTEDGREPSAGGRSPRALRFRSEAGLILVADLGASSMRIGAADLAGTLLGTTAVPMPISRGPDATMEQVETLFDQLLAERDDGAVPVWGIGVGLPGPVEFATGRAIAPPIMPGWDGYDVRGRLGAKYGAPVWVDNDVNLMALGELRTGGARDVDDFVFVKVGTGIGAGLVSNHRLHHGAQGCAGDIGHIAVTHDSTTVCRCGKTGCLEAHAGGAAIAQQGRAAAESGVSPFLANLLAEKGGIDAADVSTGAGHGDPACAEILSDAGREVGRALATLVSTFNPSLVVLGGGVINSGDLFLAATRRMIYEWSLPLATRDLRIAPSTLGAEAGATGAALLVLDQLFEPEVLRRWFPAGSPVGRPELANAL
jgi:glucokinase-like ROK family protein